MSTLKVNEIFGPTIQGEGRSQGRQVMFLRLAFCNLSCCWCDTKYTWDWQHYNRNDEVHDINNQSIVNRLSVSCCRSLVISGGEPMLQQRQLISLIEALKKQGYWIEVETNGTIAPLHEFCVDQINCSPKLSNSGDSKDRRIKQQALMSLVSLPNVFFKFVIGSETDVVEVTELVETFSISPQRVYLMPLGKTQDELKQTTAMTKDVAERLGFNFSSRLHVELYGQKRGV